MIPLASAPQALFCSIISLASLAVCLYICSRILNKELGYKVVIPYFILNAFIIINCGTEFISFFLEMFTTKYSITFAHIYMMSMYGFVSAFFWFCFCLNGKKNILVLGVSITFFIFLATLHSKGLLIDGFKYNGFTLIRIPGKLYFLLEGFSVVACLIVFILLIKYSKKHDAEIRSRAIITLFAATPILFILFTTMLLMNFTDNYTTVIFAPIFFAWMNVVLLFATGRAVVDLSFSRQHIRAYSLLLKSASIKDSSVVERMKLVEEAWYLITSASSQGNIDNMARKLKTQPEELYKKLGQRATPKTEKGKRNEFGHIEL